MKRFLVPFIVLMLILMAAGAAGAHGGVGFRIFIGLPLLFGFSYPVPSSYYQAAGSARISRNDGRTDITDRRERADDAHGE